MARTQINKLENNIVNTIIPIDKNFNKHVIKTNDVTNLINKILQYSAIKIKAKRLEPYSILNPETNSDSPSAKSNGVRLVSAKLVTNHITTTGNSINKIIEYLTNLIFLISILILTTSPINKIKAILIS